MLCLLALDYLLRKVNIKLLFLTFETNSGIPYEITTHTSDMSNSGTNADVYVVLYGQESCTEKKSLCSSKSERKKCFERGQVDKFVLEVGS